MKQKLWILLLMITAIGVITGIYVGINGNSLSGFLMIPCSVALLFIFNPLMDLLNIND